MAVIAAAQRAWEVFEDGVEDLVAPMEEMGTWLNRLDAEGLRSPNTRALGAISHDATDTQVAASLRVIRRTTVLWKILEQLGMLRLFTAVADYMGATDEELERALRRRHETVSSARNTLMRDGWIADTGRRRNGRTVWDFTPLGWETYQEVTSGRGNEGLS